VTPSVRCDDESARVHETVNHARGDPVRVVIGRESVKHYDRRSRARFQVREFDIVK
jgi:hypothetical protein